MHILFIDAINGNYDGTSLTEKVKLGGTEYTIIGVAQMLAKQIKVTVAQLNRQQATTVKKVNYISLDKIDSLKPDAVIIIRPRRCVKKFAKKFPQAKLFYWMHDIPSKRLWKYKRKFKKIGCDIIAISNYQIKLIEQAWHGKPWQVFLDKLLSTKKPKIHVIYNPVDDCLQPDTTDIKPNKLLFYSAPDRGLEIILKNFKAVKEKLNDFELTIAHPGYSSLDAYQEVLNQPGVNIIGSLAREDILKVVRESFCIFYPQAKKPECFGMVYAEANAVGTPVLAHQFGAATEILLDKSQLIDATKPENVVERLENWQKQGRPHIQLDKKFRPDAVAKAWLELLKMKLITL